MDPKWKRFEQLVAAIHFAESKGADVRWNDEINGRQFDVSVRFNYGLYNYLTVIECKDKQSKVSVGDVDAFVTKSRDINANRAVMVSARGFQSGCIAVAERHGIKLLILTETVSPEFERLVRHVVPTLSIDRVRIERSDKAGLFNFEEEGGRLNWLMLNVQIRFNAQNFCPEQMLLEWLSRSETRLTEDQEVRIPFPSGAIANIPDEEEFSAAALLFRARIVQGLAVDGPAFDSHIFASMYATVELRHPDGTVAHSARLADIPLGFATQVVPGKFYSNPTLNMNYFCERIDGEIMHMMLVESYQHGMRIGAQFTQKKKFSTAYLEITDTATIRRLEKIRKSMLQSTMKRVI